MKFFYHPSPNPAKVGLLLEELGDPYELIAVDVQKGEQHSPGYLAVNPNGKTPSLVDGKAVIFDSNAILLYLANKTGRFLSAETQPGHPQMLSWLMFVATGIGPFSGQAFHFRNVAPEPKAYALNRYDFEAWRHWKIIEARLEDRPFMMGSDYTIVDMAVWGWARALPYVLGDGVWERLPNVKRLLDTINARPAAQRAEGLKDRHAFKNQMDAATLAAMYPSNARLGAVSSQPA